MSSTLERLLHPVPPRQFLDRYWERAPLYVERAMPGWARTLLALADVDTLIAIASHGGPDELRLVKTAGEATSRPPVRREHDGRPNVAAVCDAYAAGHTVIVNGVHRRWPSIAALRAALVEDLGHPVGVNLYLTPARSQGFKAHLDGHDVFILQLSGAKHWQVFGPAVELPLEDHPAKFVERDLGTPLLDVELRPGHVLYIPRGFVHRGKAQAESSLHLTIGAHTSRWVDVVHRAVDAIAEADVRFRRTVPAGWSGADLERAVRRLLRHLADSPEAAAKAVTRHRGRVVTGSEPVPGGRFVELDGLAHVGLATRLVRRDGLSCEVADAGGKARLRFGDRSIEAPAAVAGALRFVAARRTFRVGELPDELSDDSKVVLARRLVRDGFSTFGTTKELSDGKQGAHRAEEDRQEIEERPAARRGVGRGRRRRAADPPPEAEER